MIQCNLPDACAEQIIESQDCLHIQARGRGIVGVDIQLHSRGIVGIRCVLLEEGVDRARVADALLEKLGGDSLAEMQPRFAALRRGALDQLEMDNAQWRFR